MLTKKQKEILDFVQSFSKKHGFSPSMDEVRKQFKLKSLATVHQHLDALRKKGYINKKRNEHRGMSVPTQGPFVNQSISVPVLGAVNCGMAELLAEGNIEGYLKVPINKLRKTGGAAFALRAEGDSMNRADIDGRGIEEGDYVLINFSDRSPHDGEYVLSIIDGAANIKKFTRDRKSGNVLLVSESSNPKHAKPIYLTQDDNFMINGKVITVLKK